MKFITFVVLAIFSLCLILSEGRELHTRDEVDVTYSQYSDPRCSNKIMSRTSKTGSCVIPSAGIQEKVGKASGDKLTVTCHYGTCGGNTAKTLTFENDKCTKDSFSNYYVKWEWDD